MKSISRIRVRNFICSTMIAISLITIGVTLKPQKAYAFFCANCANFVTQIMEYAEAINTAINTAEQLSTEIKQYQDVIQQGISLPASTYKSIMYDMKRLENIYNEGRTIAHNMQNLEQRFRDEFKGYDKYLASQGHSAADMSTMYSNWSQKNFDNTRNALEAAGMQTSSFASEDAILNGLVQQSSNAVGRMQAIQAGNQISAQQVQQLQRLREMIATSITLQSNYMAIQAERDAVDDAFREKFFSAPVQNTNRDKWY